MAGISSLQQQAFILSPEFQDQVNGLVVRQAKYTADFLPEITSEQRKILASVASSPVSYCFHSTIVRDTLWDTTYDTWAANPASFDGMIEGKIQSCWLMMTGVPLPPPPAPP